MMEKPATLFIKKKEKGLSKSANAPYLISKATFRARRSRFLSGWKLAAGLA